jgi:hypothetical protein
LKLKHGKKKEKTNLEEYLKHVMITYYALDQFLGIKNSNMNNMQFSILKMS